MIDVFLLIGAMKSLYLLINVLIKIFKLEFLPFDFLQFFSKFLARKYQSYNKIIIKLKME